MRFTYKNRASTYRLPIVIWKNQIERKRKKNIGKNSKSFSTLCSLIVFRIKTALCLFNFQLDALIKIKIKCVKYQQQVSELCTSSNCMSNFIRMLNLCESLFLLNTRSPKSNSIFNFQIIDYM